MPSRTPPKNGSTKPKDKKLIIRIETDLAETAQRKALRHGGLSAVVRALIRLWVEKDIVTAEEIARANERASKRPPKKN
jgi:hypothetical protein